MAARPFRDGADFAVTKATRREQAERDISYFFLKDQVPGGVKGSFTMKCSEAVQLVDKPAAGYGRQRVLDTVVLDRSRGKFTTLAMENKFLPDSR